MNGLRTGMWRGERKGEDENRVIEWGASEE